MDQLSRFPNKTKEVQTCDECHEVSKEFFKWEFDNRVVLICNHCHIDTINFYGWEYRKPQKGVRAWKPNKRRRNKSKRTHYSEY